MKRSLKTVIILLAIMIIILTPCEKSTIRADCKQDMIGCLDRLEKTNNEYKKCLTSLNESNILLKSLNNREKNLLFPYIGFRYITNYFIVPQVGIGYLRKIKSVEIGKKSFGIGAGFLFDVGFNSVGVHSIGASGAIIFMF